MILSSVLSIYLTKLSRGTKRFNEEAAVKSSKSDEATKKATE